MVDTQFQSNGERDQETSAKIIEFFILIVVTFHHIFLFLCEKIFINKIDFSRSFWSWLFIKQNMDAFVDPIEIINLFC